MKKFKFKIKSLVSIEEQDHFMIESEEQKLERIIPRELIVNLPEGYKVGDLVEITISKISTNTFFLHHFDRVNQGDVLSGAYNYFEFKNYEKISWDKNILKNNSLSLEEPYNIIMGGGIYFSDNKPRLKNIVKKSKNFIGWGLGLDERSDLEAFVKSFDLLGTREKSSKFIDNEKIFYVPCVSCMNSFFDEYLNTTVRNNIKDEVAIHLNHGFNEREIKLQFPDKKITYTTTPFLETMANISHAESVITNSYHGAYWSALMGKKVVCLATEVPKWNGLPKNILFTDTKNLEISIKKAKKIPIDYLLECRELNIEFYKKVLNLIEN